MMPGATVTEVITFNTLDSNSTPSWITTAHHPGQQRHTILDSNSTPSLLLTQCCLTTFYINVYNSRLEAILTQLFSGVIFNNIYFCIPLKSLHSLKVP